jgi:hypothetical protein
MKTTTGTNCFVSFRDACIYYQPYYASYDEAVEAVRRKVENKEIFLNKPSFSHESRVLSVVDGRYHLTEK